MDFLAGPWACWAACKEAFLNSSTPPIPRAERLAADRPPDAPETPDTFVLFRLDIPDAAAAACVDLLFYLLCGLFDPMRWLPGRLPFVDEGNYSKLDMELLTMAFYLLLVLRYMLVELPVDR